MERQVSALKFSIDSVRPQQPVSDGVWFHQWEYPAGTTWTEFYRVGHDYLLRFPGKGDFHVSGDGRWVQCHPVDDTQVAGCEHLHVTQVLPLAMGRQGHLVLHASSIRIAGRGVAFVGDSGLGKSTLAAHFASRGYPFLTDDGLVLDRDPEGFVVLPGHPSVRLWGDSHQALSIDTLFPFLQAEKLPYSEKSRLLSCPDRMTSSRPVRLGGVYFLKTGTAADRIGIERLQGADLVAELVRHSFVLDPSDVAHLARHLSQIGDLSGAARFWTLSYPLGYNLLPDVSSLVIEHETSKLGTNHEHE